MCWPPARDDARVHPVEADDVGGAKERVKNQAEDAGDAVLGENVEGVINVDEVFD